MAVRRTNTIPPIYYEDGGGSDPAPGGSSTGTPSALMRVVQPDKVFCLTSSDGSTNATIISRVPGGVASISGYNTASTPRYLKLYNQTTLPVAGTDVPFWMLYLPSQSDFNPNLGGTPVVFSQGICMAITQGPEMADASPIAAGDVTSLSVIFY